LKKGKTSNDGSRPKIKERNVGFFFAEYCTLPLGRDIKGATHDTFVEFFTHKNKESNDAGANEMSGLTTTKKSETPGDKDLKLILLAGPKPTLGPDR
jgi:hypothetical protein